MCDTSFDIRRFFLKFSFPLSLSSSLSHSLPHSLTASLSHSLPANICTYAHILHPITTFHAHISLKHTRRAFDCNLQKMTTMASTHAISINNCRYTVVQCMCPNNARVPTMHVSKQCCLYASRRLRQSMRIGVRKCVCESLYWSYFY